MKAWLKDKFAGSMRNRTMYVVPFSMGPLGSEKSKLGLQLTDTPYVALSMGVMTRMGTGALEVTVVVVVVVVVVRGVVGMCGSGDRAPRLVT